MSGRWRKVLSFVVVVGTVLIFSVMYSGKVMEMHFVDEEDNFVVGRYLLQGKILYSDIFSHHQPVAYWLSAGIQKVFEPNSIYLLIKRHREAIIGISALGGMGLVARFGLPALGFVFVYEMSKRYLFGNLFLAETLVVYPLVYLAFLIIEIKKATEWDLFGAGFLLTIIFFSLASLWPAGLLFFAVLFFGQTEKRKHLIAGMVPVVVGVMFLIPWRDYVYNTVVINLWYYLPVNTNGMGGVNILNMAINSFWLWSRDDGGEAVYLVIKSLSWLMFLNLMVFWKQRKLKRIGLIISLLLLINLRYVSPENQFYRGFHLLPWFGVLSAVVMSMTIENWKKFEQVRSRVVFAVSMMIIFLAVLAADRSLWTRNDIAKDLYVNFSTQYTMGEAIRIMKSPEDDLFVVPDEMLVFWQAEISPSSWFIFYYPWMERQEVFNSQVDKMFVNSPPTFVYGENLSKNMENYLADYVRLKKDGAKIDLYVRKEKLEELTERQKQDLRFHNIIY